MSDDASTSDELAVAAFLTDPATHGGLPVEVIETHASRVFLAGPHAYKVKKHVTFPFLDFSTLERRRAALSRELQLNRPRAPEIYEALAPVVRTDCGELAFGSEGTVIDYALIMRRFEQSALFSHIVATGPLSTDLARSLADMVARYHRSAPESTDAANVEAFVRTVSSLSNELATLAELFDGAAVISLTASLGTTLEGCRAQIEQRLRRGAVRRCHGDLHLNNIVLIDGRPVPFDALEFDERLGTVDVLYDLAFLLMDLVFRDDRAAANIVLNRYVGAAPVGGEVEGLALLPLFLATRALVRTVISAERAQQMEDDSGEARSNARRYLSLANGFLSPTPPCLVAIGGLSGTGKSTLGVGLAPDLGAAPGALHLRSDVERKHLFGVPETERLGADAYAEDVTQRVYQRLLEKADACLAAGHAAIIDAVGVQAEERQAMADIAARRNCPFAGLWLEAPVAVLKSRVTARRGDASDADAAVVESQTRYDLGALTWARIDASGNISETLRRAKQALQAAGINAGNSARMK